MIDKSRQPNPMLELWEIVRRYRWRFVLIAFLTCTAVLTVSLFLPRKYKAYALFERRTDMVLTELSRQASTTAFQNPRNSLVEEIAGPPAIESLLRRIEPRLKEHGLVRSALDRQRLRDDLLRRVVVRWDINTHALDRVRIEYIGEAPDTTAMIVNELVHQYIERSREAVQSRLRETSGFFRNELDRTRAEIEKLENRVLEFELANGELLPDNPSNVQSAMVEAEKMLSELIAERDAAAKRVETLRASLAETPETIPTLTRSRNPALTRMEDQKRELEDQLADYLGKLKMRDAHPDVVALRQQIAQLETKIAATQEEVVSQRQEAPNPKHQELELRLTEAIGDAEAAAEQVASLERRLAEMNAQVEQMFPVRSEYRKLTRQMSQAQRQLAFWEDNLRRVEMAMAADTGDRGIQLDFIKPAQPDPHPVSPNLAQVVFAAVGLGLLVGGLAVFVAYRTDESFVDPEQITEHLSLPLFGSVSELITRRHRRLRRWRRTILYPVNAAAIAGVIIALTTLLYLDLERPILHDPNDPSSSSVVHSNPADKTAE